MRQKLINTEKIQGYLYDFKLEQKKVQNKESKNFGQEYIGGSIDVLTSEDGMNIVTVKYTYVVPKTSKGTANKTYDTLLQIMKSMQFWFWNWANCQLASFGRTAAIASISLFCTRGGTRTVLHSRLSAG